MRKAWPFVGMTVSFQKSAGCKRNCFDPKMCADSAAISHTSLWSPHPHPLPVSRPVLRKSQCCCLLLHASEGGFFFPPTRPGSRETQHKRVTEKIDCQVHPSRFQFMIWRAPPHFSNFCCSNHPVHPYSRALLSCHHHYKQRQCSFRDH